MVYVFFNRVVERTYRFCIDYLPNHDPISTSIFNGSVELYNCGNITTE